jgi:hypothetical protein
MSGVSDERYERCEQYERYEYYNRCEPYKAKYALTQNQGINWPIHMQHAMLVRRSDVSLEMSCSIPMLEH